MSLESEQASGTPGQVKANPDESVMTYTGIRSVLILAAVMVTACAPVSAPTSKPSAPGEPAASAGPTRTLVILARGEPPSLAMRAFQQAGGNSNPYTVFNASLDEVDEEGTPRPVLAEALPQLNTDSWRVFPDGRMETTYRLKPDLIWHDGTALAAEDFAFAWRVYATPTFGTATQPPVGQMEEVSAQDSRTLVIRWQRPYPGAGVLRTLSQLENFQALPRHVLEPAFLQGDVEAFPNHPFWTREYVGLGPYRLSKYEPGAAMEGSAFDRFVFGRPRIERLRILFVQDANTAVANLLSGEAHIALDYLIMYEQGATLQRQWAATSGGTVLFSPLLIRMSIFQFRPEVMATPAILDLRFRRALAHAMDKAALNEAFSGGHAVLADAFLSPRVPYYAAIEPVITKYPYDPRRAQQFLEEMALPRGPDGLYLGPDRQSFSMEVMLLANPSSESENAVIVEGYQRLGVNAATRVIPVAQFGDGQVRSSYTGLLTTGAVGFEGDIGRFTIAKINRAETRWQGSNWGAWTNAAYERVFDAYSNTLDRTEQIQQLTHMERIFSEELPFIPMYYTPLVTPHAASLVGPVVRNARNADNMVHLHEWYWRS